MCFRQIKKWIMLNYNVLKYNQTCIKYSSRQKNTYKIIQISHRIEKGLLNVKPRPNWGYEKAYVLAQLISNESLNELPKSTTALEIGVSVLHSFIEAKTRSGQDEKDKLRILTNYIESKGLFICPVKSDYGGTKSLSFEDVFFNDDERLIIQKFFKSRHSIRDYSNEQIDTSTIYKAIDLAMTCPSACNRQPFHVYLMTGEERYLIENNVKSGSEMYLIITGVISAFNLDEYNDWIVNASIFSGYLGLCLHLFGIANCTIRADLLEGSNIYKKIRKTCKIPKDERIILEMSVGKYKPSFQVPISHRLETTDIVRNTILGGEQKP